MKRIALRRSRLPALPAIACALALSGCSPAARNDAAVAGQGAAAVRLSPDPAFAAARIAVVFVESEPQPAKCRFEWRRNGGVIEGASARELEPARFSKGDRISVHVTVPATDGKSRELSAEVRVANSVPRISRVGIVMEPGGGSDLRAHIDCVDPDGDATTFEYAWSRNGVRIEGATVANLPSAGLARGDRLTVAVLARDGEGESTPVDSEPFVLENHAPAFSSQPVAPGPGDAVFQYQAVATDPDGDPLRFELVHAPAGMSVGRDGVVHWSLPAGEMRRGTYPVRIRAIDAQGGEATQEFTIRL